MSLGIIASQAFSPSNFANLEVWADGTDSPKIEDSSGAVSAWLHKGSSEDGAAQPTSINQPMTGVDTINGKNIISFDGIDDYLIGGLGINGLGFEDIPLADHTIFFVAHLEEPDELQCIFGWNDGNGFTNSEVFCFGTDGKFNAVANAGMFTSAILIADDLRNKDMLVSISVDHSATVETRLDGFPKTSFSVDPVVSTDSLLICAEKDFGGSVGNFTDIKIGEIIMYTRLLPIAEILKVESYLANKWGMSMPIFPFIFSQDFSLDFS